MNVNCCAKVNDLEDARNDLHETNCRERSVVHELTLNNRQLQLNEASLRDRLTAADEQLRQLRADLDSSTQRVTQLETSLQRAQGSERGLTERCGELDAELAEWKCRLGDAMQLVETKDLELRQAAAEHLANVDRWSGKVDQLMTKNSELEASETRTKRDLMDTELRENLLRKNVEELNGQLSRQENSAAQFKEKMTGQLTTIQERLVQVEKCLEATEQERSDLEKSYDDVQGALRKTQEEKSQLLLSLTEVRRERNEAKDEVTASNESIAGLQDRLLSSSNKCSVLEDWLSEISGKNDAAEQLWRGRMESVEAEKRQLQSRIVELQNDVRLRCFALSVVYVIEISEYTFCSNITVFRDAYHLSKHHGPAFTV